MCVIIAKDYDTKVKKEHITNAIDSNPDGIGYYAFNRKNSRFEWQKGLDKNLAIRNRIMKLIDKPDVRLVFHSRITTHGLTDDKRCHPFNIRDTDWMLFHNGMISISPEKKDWSDTQQFAHEVGVLMKEGHNLSEIIEAYYTTFNWSKLVFINRINGEWKFWNHKSGTVVDGVWHSNNSALSCSRYSNWVDSHSHNTHYYSTSREYYDDDAYWMNDNYIYENGKWIPRKQSKAAITPATSMFNLEKQSWDASELPLEATPEFIPDLDAPFPVTESFSETRIGYHPA